MQISGSIPGLSASPGAQEIVRRATGIAILDDSSKLGVPARPGTQGRPRGFRCLSQ